MTATPDINEYLADPATRADPYPMLAALRAESDGVAKTEVGPRLILSYDASRKAMIDKRISRWQAALNELDPRGAATPEIRRAIEASQQMMINRDGADHARLRRLIMAAFMPKALAQWEEQIDQVVVGLIDKVADKDEYDFRTEVAFPLPEIVICRMLGVPHEDHHKWSQWFHDSVAANRAAGASGENLRRAQEATYHIYNYFLGLIEERREDPGDDLLSTLIAARDDDDKLSTDELIGTANMLIAAGHETTANLITNLMHFLIVHPEELRKLRDDPSKIPNAVQEAVRLFSPAHFGLPRLATADIQVCGHDIPAGSPLMVVWAAANRDPAVFDDPDKFDTERPELARQTGFGFGVHVCIGRKLAEMEAERMFTEIVKRLPDLELAEVPEIAASFTRGYKSLRVRRKR